jgi:hypothetical protein
MVSSSSSSEFWPEKDSYLLHYGLQKSLGDLARGKAGHVGIDHRLDKLAGGHTDSGLGYDFGCRLEDAIGVLIEGHGDSCGFAH